jgi:hypothetical protein
MRGRLEVLGDLQPGHAPAAMPLDPLMELRPACLAVVENGTVRRSVGIVVVRGAGRRRLLVDLAYQLDRLLDQPRQIEAAEPGLSDIQAMGLVDGTDKGLKDGGLLCWVGTDARNLGVVS